MNKILISFFISLNVILVSAFAGTNFDVRGPNALITTVGKLTEIRIDIFNNRATQDSYTVQITGVPSNVIEITNPSIATQTVNPNQNIQIASNIRTLTEDTAVINFVIASTGTSEQATLSIRVQSKKFSLPEFGLIGFIQIIVLAAISYFLLFNKNKLYT